MEFSHTFTGKGMSDQTWTKVYPIDEKFGVLHKAKVHVFSYSVLGVGGSAA